MTTQPYYNYPEIIIIIFCPIKNENILKILGKYHLKIDKIWEKAAYRPYADNLFLPLARLLLITLRPLLSLILFKKPCTL